MRHPVAPFTASILVLRALALGEPLAGEATIRGEAGGSEIVIKTTSRLAGAIDSLTWKGLEFINSFDHGRQLQSASNLDAGSPIKDETFNPTEAGSRRDGAGPTSSSRLLSLKAENGELNTVSQMAFWLAPGDKSGENLAKNTGILSEHLLSKRVRIGYREMPNVISYDVTFTVPAGENHKRATFEALTAYQPPALEEFLQFNAETGELEPLSNGPGEGPRPIVFTVPGGSHALGIYAPPQPAANTVGPTYGRFRFDAAKVVKWNCVFRVRNEAGLAPGEYPYRMFVIVGDLAMVKESMQALHREFAGR